jgi:hypothetical protein
MVERGPQSAEALIAGGAVLRWPEAELAIADARFYWLATVGPSGAPHVRPVFGVWSGGAVYSTTAPSKQKGRNLAADPRCALSLHTDKLDLVVESRAARVGDAATLELVAAAYRAKYGWPVTVAADALDAPYGAPTAGSGPYVVNKISPVCVVAFTIDDEAAPRPTRWRF